MDEIDKKIVSELQRDGKLKLKELAAALNMTNSPVFEGLNQMELFPAI